MTITDKAETCPVGTRLNPVTGECDPYWDETGGDETDPPVTPPVTPPVKPPVTPPVKPPVTPPVKPPVTPTTSTAPSFTPSGAYTSTETIDPIYAGAMGDFDLFATLEELLASDQDKKDSANSKVRTKMATGGHLDSLLAEQITVDDLLKLLR